MLAKTINDDAQITGVIIQHEYGIFGAQDGQNLLFFMRNCTKPMLVTLHTILPSPTPHMKEITQEIIKLSSSVIVLTKRSKSIIERLYTQSAGKVFIIPHGIHPTTFSGQKVFKKKLNLNRRTILATFGLLSRGKGLEYVLRALPDVIKKHPSVMYLILGETHPMVVRQEGENYRIELLELIQKLHLEKHVAFYDQYLTLTDLLTFLKATDIYISTSVDPNQAVSGTLSYALGTGRAVISTDFAQAKEIVTPAVGRLVPIKNSQAIKHALLELLSDRHTLEKMSSAAYAQTRDMLWDNVGKQYISLLKRTITPPLKTDHLSRLTDDFGLLQFSTHAIPDKHSGYTLDDNARALIVCSWMMTSVPSGKIKKLMDTYLGFLQKCVQPDGSIINYIGYNSKMPTDQNTVEDLEDARARALWALSEVMSNNILHPTMRRKAKILFVKLLKDDYHFTHLRAKAFAIKAIALAYDELPEYQSTIHSRIIAYADSLMLSLKDNSHKSWLWFEDRLHYSNGLLPESLLIAGDLTNTPQYTLKGLKSFEFLINKTFSSDMYRPIGHSKWYKNKHVRSSYDQQPEDPAAMILALNCAYRITNNNKYKLLAQKCYSWFLGNNTIHRSLYDSESGGCYDGLHPDRVNLNQGAESLVSFLMSSYVINGMQS